MAESERERKIRLALEEQRKKNQSTAARKKRAKKRAWWDRMKDGG